MALPSGLAGQVGYVSETQYGLPVTVTRFVPFLSETFAADYQRIESAGIVAGARVLRSEQWRPGNIAVAGDIQHELYQQGIGVLFRNMLGSVTSSATAGVATHTFSPGETTNQSFTIQIGRPMTTGVVVPYTYAGCKITSWEIACAAGEIVTFGTSVIGQSETTGITLATVSFLPGQLVPFTFVDGTVSISGSNASVRNITISGQSNLTDDRRYIGSRVIDQPLENDLSNYSGSMMIDFSSTDMYNRIVAGTEAPVVLSLSAGAAAKLTVTMNARFDGGVPQVGGRGILTAEYPFKCVATTSLDDSTAIKAVMVNSQTSL